MPSLDLSSYLDGDTLTLTGIASKRYKAGHAYDVPSLSAGDGLLLQQIMSEGITADGAALTDKAATAMAKLLKGPKGEQLTLAQKLLGPALDRMIEDGVPHDSISKIERVVAMHYGFGEEVAVQFVAGVGEAQARAKRAATKRTRKSTAGSKSSPASTPTPARTVHKQATTRTSGRSSTSPSGRAAARKTA